MAVAVLRLNSLAKAGEDRAVEIAGWDTLCSSIQTGTGHLCLLRLSSDM